MRLTSSYAPIDLLSTDNQFVSAAASKTNEKQLAFHSHLGSTAKTVWTGTCRWKQAKTVDFLRIWRILVNLMMASPTQPMRSKNSDGTQTKIVFENRSDSGWRQIWMSNNSKRKRADVMRSTRCASQCDGLSISMINYGTGQWIDDEKRDASWPETGFSGQLVSRITRYKIRSMRRAKKQTAASSIGYQQQQTRKNQLDATMMKKRERVDLKPNSRVIVKQE